MKYLTVEGVRRLRLRGSAVGEESPIQYVLFRSSIRLARPRRWPIFDLISDDRWRWALLLEFEAEAMSSVSPFLISVFATIRRLGLLPYVFRLGFGFFFWESMAHGFATICWACHMLFFSLDWFCFLICFLVLMFGFGQGACFVKFFFFFFFLILVLILIFFLFLLESRIDNIYIYIYYFIWGCSWFCLRVFLIFF